jgi:hypothetical protein
VLGPLRGRSMDQDGPTATDEVSALIPPPLFFGGGGGSDLVRARRAEQDSSPHHLNFTSPDAEAGPAFASPPLLATPPGLALFLFTPS